MGHLIYWAEERMDSCVCGTQRNGSVWNPSEHISMQIRMLQKLKLSCQLSFWTRKHEPDCPLLFLRGSVMSLSVHPSGKLALTVGADQTLRWSSDILRSNFWPQIELRSSTINTDCWAFSTYRTWNLINGRSAFIKNIKQSEPRHSTKVSEPAHEISQTFLRICFFFLDAHIVRWSPDGDNYAVVINDKVDIYELETASVTATITNPKRISSLQFLNVGFLNLDIFLLYRFHRLKDNDM